MARVSSAGELPGRAGRDQPSLLIAIAADRRLVQQQLQTEAGGQWPLCTLAIAFRGGQRGSPERFARDTGICTTQLTLAPARATLTLQTTSAHRSGNQKEKGPP